jgi:argininosuccinate lyase
MAEKLWGGRFKGKLDEDAYNFSASLAFDQRLAIYDLRTNLAHAKALRKHGYLADAELERLEKFFKELEKRFIKQDVTLFNEDEDIHSCIERLVTEELGEIGQKLHTGKSRNDQIATDLRLFVKDEIRQVVEFIEEVFKAIYELANENKELIIPGFTHLQSAQPVLLAHHLLAYYEKFARDKQRFLETLERVDVCPLGSGALAGNNYEIDRALIAKELGFSRLSKNSMDAVSDRDFVLDFCANAALCMVHLSQIAEELILWSSPLVGFLEIGDGFSTGSSIMPQKKNPDIAELIRGKTGRVIGHNMALLNVLKGLPLTYNRDLQEDKEALFDVVDTLKNALNCFAKMLKTITFHKTAFKLALMKGYLFATDFADYLVKKGIPFRQAHKISGKIVLFAQEKGKNLEELQLDDFKRFSDLIGKDVYEVFDYKKAIESKNVYGGTAYKRVEYQLKKIKEEYAW